MEIIKMIVSFLCNKIERKKYGDAHLYKQAGNAVSVDMITMIAREILEILD